jgi:hypothetical protein
MYRFDECTANPTNSCTAPGGYVEFCEADMNIYSDDGTMKEDNPFKIYADSLRSALIKMDRPPRDMKYYENLLKSAGFVDIQTSFGKEPVGPWAKDPRMKKIGAMQLLHCETVYESYGMAAFTRVLGMDPKDAKAICDGARSASNNKNFHTYFL